LEVDSEPPRDLLDQCRVPEWPTGSDRGANRSQLFLALHASRGLLRAVVCFASLKMTPFWGM
jgi:hypothetical protein